MPLLIRAMRGLLPHRRLKHNADPSYGDRISRARSEDSRRGHSTTLHTAASRRPPARRGGPSYEHAPVRRMRSGGCRPRKYTPPLSGQRVASRSELSAVCCELVSKKTASLRFDRENDRRLAAIHKQQRRSLWLQLVCEAKKRGRRSEEVHIRIPYEPYKPSSSLPLLRQPW